MVDLVSHCVFRAGFIGSNLVDELLSLGYWVRVLDNLSTGDLRYVPVDHPRLQLLYVDITDYAALLDGISRPWTGCAALNCPAQVYPSPLFAESTVVWMVRHCLQGC